LKRAHFVKKVGKTNNTGANRNKFANKTSGQLAARTDTDFINAKKYLLTAPPRQQKVDAAESMGWEWMPHDPQGTESDEQHLLRLVRDVRNNLFHGGKYPKPNDDLLDGRARRNSELLEACLTILDTCRSLDADVKKYFEQTS